jgi:hypothetical protein
VTRCCGQHIVLLRGAPHCAPEKGTKKLISEPALRVPTRDPGRRSVFQRTRVYPDLRYCTLHFSSGKSDRKQSWCMYGVHTSCSILPLHSPPQRSPLSGSLEDPPPSLPCHTSDSQLHVGICEHLMPKTGTNLEGRTLPLSKRFDPILRGTDGTDTNQPEILSSPLWTSRWNSICQLPGCDLLQCERLQLCTKLTGNSQLIMHSRRNNHRCARIPRLPNNGANIYPGRITAQAGVGVAPGRAQSGRRAGRDGGGC